MSAIYFDKATARAFRDAYEKARDAGQEQFTFAGNEVLLSYARYMVEYLKSKGLLNGK